MRRPPEPRARYHAQIEAQTQSFANTLLPAFRELAKTAKILDMDALKRHPLIASIDLHVRSAMQNTRVVKVKFYDTQGRTIFSTDATQIGRDYRDNAGFISALEGHPLSELTHRDRFSAFDREIVDRDVLSSYVAMRTANDAPSPETTQHAQLSKSRRIAGADFKR